MQKLAELSPQADPPSVGVSDAVLVHITAEVLLKVLKRLPRGSGAGLSGWTYEHIRVACACNSGMFEVTLVLVNLMVAGSLPDIPELLACRLVHRKNTGTVDGVRPIAVGETWLQLAALCAMEACPTTGKALLPLQFGVGVAGPMWPLLLRPDSTGTPRKGARDAYRRSLIAYADNTFLQGSKCQHLMPRNMLVIHLNHIFCSCSTHEACQSKYTVVDEVCTVLFPGTFFCESAGAGCSSSLTQLEIECERLPCPAHHLEGGLSKLTSLKLLKLFCL